MKRRELLKAAAALSVVPMMPSLLSASSAVRKAPSVVQLRIDMKDGSGALVIQREITPDLKVTRQYFGLVGFDANNKLVGVRRAMLGFSIMADRALYGQFEADIISKEIPKQCSLVEKWQHKLGSYHWEFEGDSNVISTIDQGFNGINCTSSFELADNYRHLQTPGGRVISFYSNQEEDELWLTNVDDLVARFSRLPYRPGVDEFIPGRPLKEPGEIDYRIQSYPIDMSYLARVGT